MQPLLEFAIGSGHKHNCAKGIGPPRVRGGHGSGNEDLSACSNLGVKS